MIGIKTIRHLIPIIETHDFVALRFEEMSSSFQANSFAYNAVCCLRNCGFNVVLFSYFKSSLLSYFKPSFCMFLDVPGKKKRIQHSRGVFGRYLQGISLPLASPPAASLPGFRPWIAVSSGLGARKTCFGLWVF